MRRKWRKEGKCSILVWWLIFLRNRYGGVPNHVNNCFFFQISKQRKSKKTSPRVEVKGKCERTFVTFDNDIDDRLFDSYFPKVAKRERRSQICAITRLPARYFDPVTQLPYRNKQAFKILREAYYQQLEDRGNPQNPDVSKWLEWRKKIKDFRIKSLNKNSSLLGMISSSGGA